MLTLSGKTALLTGASGGLGTAVTQAFLSSGARVAGISRSIQSAPIQHPSFTAWPADLLNPAAARETILRAHAALGRIDILVHIMGGFAGGMTVAETADDTIQQMLDLNYRSAFHVLRAVIPAMRQQGSGRILAVASRQAAEPAALTAAYSASKAALVALIRAVALENADRSITANTVLPGTMDTPANRAAMPDADPSQWVQPAQVAALLVHLASDSAAQITGAAIPVYGLRL